MKFSLGALSLLVLAVAAVAAADDGDSVKKKKTGNEADKKSVEVDVSKLKKEHRSIDFGIPLPDEDDATPSSTSTVVSTSTTTQRAPSPKTQPPPPPPPPGAPPPSNQFLKPPQGTPRNHPPSPPPPASKGYKKSPPGGWPHYRPYPVTPKYIRPPALGVGPAPPRQTFKSTPSSPPYPKPIQSPSQRPVQNPNQRPIQGPPNQRPVQGPNQRPIQNQRPNPRNPRPNQRPRPRNLPPPPPKQFAKRPPPRPQFRPKQPLRPPPPAASRPQLPPPGSRPPPPPPPRPQFKSPVPQKKRPPTKKPTNIWKKPFPSPKYEQPEPVRREYFDEDVQQSSFSEQEPVYQPPPPSFGFGLGVPQQPEVVVKQAGPSQSFGWLGHGRSININSLLIPNPFPDAINVNTKWVPAVDHSMEQLVHHAEHAAHSAHIEPAPSQPDIGNIDLSSDPSPASVPATPVPKARPPVPTYAPVPEPPAPSYAPRPVRKATISPIRKVTIPSGAGTYHTQSGHGYSFSSNPSKARQTLRPTLQLQGGADGTPVYVPQSSNALNTFEKVPVKLFDHSTKSFVTKEASRPPPSPPPPPPAPATPRPPRKTTFGGDPRTKSAASIERPSYVPPPPKIPGSFKGSFIDVSAQRDYPKKPQQPQAKIDVFDVPIKVEETFEAAKEKLDELVQFKTALATPEKSGGGGEEDVFYIFYESDDSKPSTTTIPSVKTRVRPTSPRLRPFVVEEPADSKFKPPSAEDIRTIYVPIENAINVPEHFDINVGSSFGTSKKKSKSRSRSRSRTPINPRQKVHNPKRARGSSGRATTPSSAAAAPAPADLAGFKSATAAAKVAGSSYDNPISSYDAPLTIEKSYTAPQTVRGSFFDGSASTRKYQEIRRVPVDSAVEASEPGPETAESSLYEPPSDSTVFGTRLSGKRRKSYDIILDNRDTKSS